MNHAATKFVFPIFLLFIFLSGYFTGQAQKTYILISKTSGKLNNKLIASLPPSLKGLAALYSAVGGTGCADQQCGLTTALGLGNQGSAAQKDLIIKYFPQDKVANLVLGQDCYLAPSGASAYSNFASLSFLVKGDEIEVDYELDVFEHGSLKKINGPDIYLFKYPTFKNKKRVLYAWADK